MKGLFQPKTPILWQNQFFHAKNRHPRLFFTELLVKLKLSDFDFEWNKYIAILI